MRLTTYIIADIGACHDGQYARMVSAVHAAAEAGVDAIKFQWTSDPDAMARRRGRAHADGYADIYRRYLNWPGAWHHDLQAACGHAFLNPIDYLCTVFLPEDVAVVAPYVRHFKVASFEASDAAMFRAYLPFMEGDKTLFVSLGMGQTRDALEEALGFRRTRDQTMCLLCTSSYPAPVESLNLRRLLTRDGMGDLTLRGFSDHSDPELTMTGALGVAAGARVVEAHLRLDDTDPTNPDYPHAMTPDQFRDYVRNVRFAERCLGDGVRRLQACERAMAQYRVEAT